MNLQWVLEWNLFVANDQQGIKQWLLDRESCVQLVDFVPFSHDILPRARVGDPISPERAFALGSTNFVRTVHQLGWNPGVWYDRDRFAYTEVTERLGDLMLNADAKLERLGHLDIRSPKFIRPLEDLKPFVGGVVHPDRLQEWRDQITRYSVISDEHLVNDDMEIMVAEPKAITAEFRFFVIDERIVAGCRYRNGAGDQLTWSASPTRGAEDMARRAMERWRPAPGFVVDVARTEAGEYRILEYNLPERGRLLRLLAGGYRAGRRRLLAPLGAWAPRRDAKPPPNMIAGRSRMKNQAGLILDDLDMPGARSTTARGKGKARRKGGPKKQGPRNRQARARAQGKHRERQ